MVESSHYLRGERQESMRVGGMRKGRKRRRTMRKLGPHHIKNGRRVNRKAVKHPKPCRKKPRPCVRMCLAVTKASCKSAEGCQVEAK